LHNVSIADPDPGNVNFASATIARTIPGLRKAHVAVPRRPVRSVRLNDFAIANGAQLKKHGLQAALGRGLASVVLPLASTALHRWRVLLNLLTAYAVVFLSLLIIHIPSVIKIGARSRIHAAETLWADLLGSHLGHLVLFGALIALLSYTEGLLDADVGSSWYEHSLIAVKVAFWSSLVVGVGLRLCGTGMDALTLLMFAITITTGLMAAQHFGPGSRAEVGAGDRRSKNVLIVAATATARPLAKQLVSLQNSGRVVKGTISRSYSGAPSVVATVDELVRVARAEYIDEIIIAGGQDRELAQRAVVEAVRNHLDVSIVPDLFIDQPAGLGVQMFEGMPLISIHQEPIPRLGLLLKRVMDVTIAAISSLISLPLMIVIAAAIKLESRGPVLYTALRAGKKGRTFKCYKFRTMRADADRAKDLLRAHNQRQGPTFKVVNDPRITPLGRILRRYSLDELPQLWNVLTGTMSLVGPRPHPMDDYQRYALEDRRRLDVAPGITGLWQITARNDPSFSTNMALDLQYIENWSLRMDLTIILKTFPAVLSGSGA
jgi:exopolysaccharide biosynthesis polyprenyl glycosylphosphotransferase